MQSVKQGGIKYHFFSLWYDLTWDWNPSFLGPIGEYYSLGPIIFFKKREFVVSLIFGRFRRITKWNWKNVTLGKKWTICRNLGFEGIKNCTLSTRNGPPKSLEKQLEESEISGRSENKMIAFAEISYDNEQRSLETWGDLLSLRLTGRTTQGKNWKKSQERDKYVDLIRELKKLWNMKLMDDINYNWKR